MSAQHLAEKVAKLNIKLVHGENLPRRAEDKEPEYVCRLRISKPHPTPEHEIPRTRPVKGSVSPEFNQEFQLDVKNPPAAQMEILIWDVSPMTENPPGKEVFIGDVLVNVGKLIDYAGETIKWPFEIRKRTTAGIEAHGKLFTQIVFDQDCNVDLYLDHSFRDIQDKDMFGREVHGAFEEALKTKPDRIILNGVAPWTENGVEKGTRCQIKMVPAPLAAVDKRNIKTMKNDVSKLDMNAAKYPLNKCTDVKLDNETMAPPVNVIPPQAVNITQSFQAKPAALKSAPPGVASFQAKPGPSAEEMVALGGELTITVAQLSHLPNMDMLGKCDPVVTMNLAGQEHKTSKAEKVYDTSWPNEPKKFVIPPKSAGADNTLKIRVVDADKYTEKDVVGYCDLDILPLVANGMLTSPLLDEKQKIYAMQAPIIGQDKEGTVIHLTATWKGNTTAPVVPAGPTAAELAAQAAERKAAEERAAQAKRDAETAEAKRKQLLAWEQEEREVAAEAEKKKADEERLRIEAANMKAQQDAEIERMRLAKEAEERARLAALAAAPAPAPAPVPAHVPVPVPVSKNAVEGSGQWIKMRIELAKSVADLPTGREGIEKFRSDVISDVAESAGVDVRDVYFQEIDISTVDPAKSIVVDLYVNGGSTEGAKVIVNKCTSAGTPSDNLRSGRKITNTAVGIKTELHYAGPSNASASKVPTKPNPKTIPGTAEYNAAYPIPPGVDPRAPQTLSMSRPSSTVAPSAAPTTAPVMSAVPSSGTNPAPPQFTMDFAPKPPGAPAMSNGLPDSSSALKGAFTPGYKQMIAQSDAKYAANASSAANGPSPSMPMPPLSGSSPANNGLSPPGPPPSVPGGTMKLSLGLGIAIYNMGDVAVFKDNMCGKVAQVAKVDKSKVQVVGVEPDGDGMKCHLTVTDSPVSSSEIMSQLNAK